MGASCSCLKTGQSSAQKEGNQPLEVSMILPKLYALHVLHSSPDTAS